MIVVAMAATWAVVTQGSLWSVPLACAVDVPLAMIYFHLLGRLAAC